MPIDAFVLRYQGTREEFVKSFLASGDFDLEALRRIARERSLRSGRNKGDYVDIICEHIDQSNADRVASIILHHLLGRKRDWISIRLGRVKGIPQCTDPTELVFSRGNEQWYGPLSHPFDQEASWYIRPVYVEHWEREDHEDAARRFEVRWLCFARVVEDVVSLHWRGFTHSESVGAASLGENGRSRTYQFAYWEHIPTLITEFEALAEIQLQYAELHNLVLYDLWSKYQDNSDFQWRHQRIRAEAGGVALSAHAGGVVEVDLEDESKGISKLATTIRRSVQRELETTYQQPLPNPEQFDHVILRTLIREYGALSYEFRLSKEGTQILRAHTYFGSKKNSNTADMFPHLRVYISQRGDIDQLNFLLQHIRGDVEHADSRVEQNTLL